MSTLPLGANKPVDDIDAALLAATKKFSPARRPENVPSEYEALPLLGTAERWK
jgi:hypothetical protein